MRHLCSILFLGISLSLSAQTVVTVQNGPWTAPSTWDCNCVPGPGSSLVIMHSVEITSDLTFTFPQVQVMTTGEITMSFPAVVELGGTFIVEGHVFLIGEVANLGGTIDVSGFFEVVGVFSSDGDLIMDGGMLQVEGDFINFLAVSGDGSICVYDSTANQGTITGTVDICDATPTTAMAPILDTNSGTVAGTVTFCTNSACGFASVQADEGEAIQLLPNPSTGPITVTGLHGVNGTLTLRDAAGRACWRRGLTGSEPTVAIEAPGKGLYMLELATDLGIRSWKLIFAEGIAP